jgi:peroxiredoxin
VILKPDTTISIEGDFNDLLATLKSSDSKVNEDYFVFNRSYAALREPEEYCVQQYRNYTEVNKNEDSATYYLTKIKVMQDESDQLVKTTIDKIFPSFAIYGILNYLRIEQEFDYISKLAVRIKNEMPDGKYARLFVQEIGRMQTYKDQQAQKDASENVVVGKAAPEFSANTPEGKKVSLSDYKGKYVLVDFWASWCGPCRAESPNMVKLYQDFKGSKFEIIGVSLDNDKTAWTKAIAKDRYTWIQISDLLQWDSPIARLYQVDGIPATVLIDPNGVVVAKNLRGEELYNKIKTLLHD